MKNELVQQAITDHAKPIKIPYPILIWLFASGTIFMMVLPFVVGVMTDQLGFSEADSGRVVMFGMLGLFIVKIVATLSVHKWNLRICICFALSIMALSEILMAFTTTLKMMNMLRFMSGLAVGTLLASLMAYISGFKYSDSIFGITFAGKFTIGAIALFTFPYLIKFAGAKGVFLCLGFMPILGLFLMPWFLKKDPRAEAEHINIPTWSLLSNIKSSLVFLCVALVLLFIANSALWTYYELIGTKSGIPLERIGLGLSLSMIGGLLGGSLAAWVGTKLIRTVSIALGLVAMAGSVALIIFHINILTYSVSMLIFTIGFSFILPFVFGAASESDHSGRLLAFMAILSTLGSLLGPALASFSVGRDSYMVLMLGVIGFLILSLFFVLLSKPGLFQSRLKTA